MLKQNVTFNESVVNYPFTIQLGLVLLNSGNLHSWYDINYAVHSIKINSDLEEYQDVIGTYHINMPAPEDKEQDRIRLELACFKPHRLKKQLDLVTHSYNSFFVDVHEQQQKYFQDRFILTTHPFSLFFKKSRMFYKRKYKNKEFNCLISKIQPDTFQTLNTPNQPPLSISHYVTEEDKSKPYQLIDKHSLFFKELLNTENTRVINNVDSSQFLNLLESLNTRLNMNEGFNHILIKDETNKNKDKKELVAA